MSEFVKIFTTTQTKNLLDSGIKSLYDLVTYFPFRIQRIVPFGQSVQSSDDVFLVTATLKNISHRKNKRVFLVLDFVTSEGQALQLYLFSVAKFTLKILQPDKQYQLLLKKKDSFWSIVRYTAYNQGVQALDYFVLGKAEERMHYQPVYKKIGKLRSSNIITLHNRLDDSAYRLSLDGLVPVNNIIPQVINLKNIHKPSSIEDYKRTLKQWISLKSYLKLAMINYIEYQNQDEQSVNTKLDLDYLKRLSSSLPYTLSKSQKLAIWEILQEITY